MHATDATNASRTLLFNIHTGDWDDELLQLLRVPRAMLPEVQRLLAPISATPCPSCSAARSRFAASPATSRRRSSARPASRPAWSSPPTAPAASCCSTPARRRSPRKNRLLTTIAYQLGGKRTYALEGTIFVAGAAVQWLRDGLGIIKHGRRDRRARRAVRSRRQAVYLVPAFVGLGAPYWDPRARGALFGLTRDTGPAELARAALESVCYQTLDLLDAMRADWPDAHAANTVLRVDGGMAASDWTMQRLADMLDAPVDRPIDPGDHRARRGLSRRARGRRLSRARKIRRPLAARTPLQTEHERGHKRTEA